MSHPLLHVDPSSLARTCFSELRVKSPTLSINTRKSATASYGERFLALERIGFEVQRIGLAGLGRGFFQTRRTGRACAYSLCVTLGTQRTRSTHARNLPALPFRFLAAVRVAIRMRQGSERPYPST